MVVASPVSGTPALCRAEAFFVPDFSEVESPPRTPFFSPRGEVDEPSFPPCWPEVPGSLSTGFHWA